MHYPYGHYQVQFGLGQREPLRIPGVAGCDGCPVPGAPEAIDEFAQSAMVGAEYVLQDGSDEPGGAFPEANTLAKLNQVIHRHVVYEGFGGQPSRNARDRTWEQSPIQEG